MYGYYIKEENKTYIKTFYNIEEARKEQTKDKEENKKVSAIYKSTLKAN